MPFGGLLTIGLGTGLSMYGKHKQGKQAEKAAKDQANLNNQDLAARRMAQAKMLAGLEAGGWNPFGVNSLGSSSESSGTSNTSGVRDSYTKENPFTTAEYGKSDELVRGILENRLSRGSSLPPGYEANAIRAINAASAGGAAAAGNAAARRGLSGQQVFGLNAPIQTARAGQIADLRGNVPLLERQMANEDMAAQGDRQARFGTGRESRTHETSSSRTNSSGRGSDSRQVGPDIGALSSLLMPPGAQQSTVSPYSGWGNALEGIGAGVTAYGAMKQGQQGSSGGGGGASSSGGFSNPQITGCPKTSANPFGIC
jgi:hypothetical protein